MSKLPDFADWRRPWKDGDLDEEKAAKLVYNLKVEVEKEKEKVDKSATDLSALQVKLDEATESLAEAAAGTGKDGESSTVVELKRQVRQLEKEKGAVDPATQGQIDRLEIALKVGLTLANAKRLVGETRTDLEADALVLAKDLGIDVAGSGDEGDEGSKDGPPQRGVLTGTGLRTGSDPVGGRQAYETDPSKVVLPSSY